MTKNEFIQQHCAHNGIPTSYECLGAAEGAWSLINYRDYVDEPDTTSAFLVLKDKDIESLKNHVSVLNERIKSRDKRIEDLESSLKHANYGKIVLVNHIKKYYPLDSMRYY